MLVRGARGTVALARAGCAAAFAGMCALALVQVINRYLLGLPMFWTEELVLLLFVWSVMLGVPVAIWHREEIVVDIVSFLPGGTLERGRRAIVDLCSTGFLIALAWSGLELVERGGFSLSPALGLSRGWFYASIPIGAALGVVALLARRLAPPAPPLATAPSDAAAPRD
jgi:TRAP-type C4-dicarboxylate transport system permease small subunit